MDPALERVAWQLVYADGRRVLEHEEGLSIKVAPPGASALEIVERVEAGQLRTIATVRLGGLPVPVFYRRKTIRLDGTGRPEVERVVFGRAGRVEDGRIQAHLWEVQPGLAVDVCSEGALDPAAVTSIVEALEVR